MDTTAPEAPARRPLLRAPNSRTATLLLAISFGLCAGYLDLGFLFLKKYCWTPEGYFRNASDFPWTVPLGHAVLMIVPGLLLGAVHRRWPHFISVRTLSWLFATLALWSALLRMPLYSQCSLLLAAGLGRVIGDAVAGHDWRPRQIRSIWAALVGVLAVLAVLSSGWQAVREYRTVAGLSPAPPHARNVVLIVWDTVRADELSLYGYSRPTTPNLQHWAEKGVAYKLAVAPAPWTFPSHACFFTGQWPFRLNSQWKFTLDAPGPTLAEFLTTRGYQTAGFVANTNCCSYETGLGRGFAHFADYVLTPRSILARTVTGKWILENILSYNNFYDRKWIGLQSRGAAEISDNFVQWLARRRPDRPFFAFLNYFDAHEPYIPPPGFEKNFGIAPVTAHDFQLLVDYVGMIKNDLSDRDMELARDCYDDCIASLDAQLGRVVDALERQGLLDNTVVIITSDHGEAFGYHGIIGHSYTALLEETGVPLVILAPDAPARRVVACPVSLRDLPATVLDLLGLSAASPFPGRSLAAYWKLAPDDLAPGVTSPALSEQASPIAFQTQPESGRGHARMQMSLAALDHHYIRNGEGFEQLYDLRKDPYELMNLMESKSGNEKVAVYRKMLLDALTDEPGSPEVEKAYLATYRKWLDDLVHGRSPQSLAASD